MLINNNRIPFEDDILIPAQQSTSGATDRNAIISRDGFLRWPNAQIPYVISADYSIPSPFCVHV
jgi:hypothetical protein